MNMFMMNDKSRKKILIIVISVFTAAVFIAAVFFIFLFSPVKRSQNESKSVEDAISGMDFSLYGNELTVLYEDKEVFSTEKDVKVSDFIVCDIDKNGDNELLILCDKKGKYGEHRPFWDKEEDKEVVQHIYIYDCDKGNVKAKWMSSDIGFTVCDWEYDGAALLLTDDKGDRTYWTWKNWGLEKAEDYITLLAVGDNIIHSSLIRRAEEDGMNFDYAYNKITPAISKMDISMVVSETPLVDKKSAYGDYPSFGTPREVALSLRKAGFDIAACATNHCLDRGGYGLDCTVDSYNNVGILPLGIDESEAVIKEIKGMRIAFLNYTGVINTQKNELNTVYRINYLGNESEVREKIRKAKEASDFVVMVVHWGTEYSKEVDANQKKWAGIFLEEGVDLCIGSHSHVTGPVEVLEGEEGDMLTYYSLGNFFSAQDKEDTDKGMAAYVAIGTDNGEPVILSHKEYEIDIKKDGVVLKNK